MENNKVNLTDDQMNDVTGGFSPERIRPAKFTGPKCPVCSSEEVEETVDSKSVSSYRCKACGNIWATSSVRL